VGFVALPIVTIAAVDAATGAAISAGLDYDPVELDDSDQGTYDEAGHRGRIPNAATPCWARASEVTP